MKYAILGALLILSGCASNPYKKFYTDQTEGKELSTLPVVIPNNEPRLIHGTDPNVQSEEMFENGYVMLGYSSFIGALSDESDALDFAKKVHADVVVVYSSFSNTVSGSMPVSIPTSQTSYTTANATAYGSNGASATAYGSGTTTTYGTQTSYIPYSVDRYNQGAQFWIKGKPRVFGAATKEMSSEKRREIASNKGVEITSVIKGSPAFNADFLRGDVIKKIAGIEITSQNCYTETIGSNAGKNVEIEFMREGKTIKKSVKLNDRS